MNHSTAVLIRITCLTSAIVLGVMLLGCARVQHNSIRAQDPFPGATPARVKAVTDKVFPAVVRLDVAQEVYTDGKRNLRRGIGSGVIIDEQGHILTNYHVAGRAAEIFITLANKERVRARLVGDDHWTDLAVVQLDMEEVKRRNITFSHAELGRSDTLLVGQDVIAIGTPFGLARTMTLGIVSNNDRTFYPDRQRIDEYETGEFNNWIQMDTPIAPGNSGGPLVDLNGRIVGINTRGIQGQSLNFAIPIDTAKAVANEIIASATPQRKGRVERSDLGLDLKPLQDLESFYEIDINRGVLINSVARGSSSAKAGVRPQDILLSINDHDMNVRFPEEVAPTKLWIASLPVGTDCKLVVRRGRETVILHAKTERLQSAVGEERELKAWGLSIRGVTRAYATDAQLDDATGVLVTTISPGLPGEKAQLARGDVIKAVNGKPVTDLDEFMTLYNASVEAKEPSVFLDIQRGRGKRSLLLRVTY